MVRKSSVTESTQKAEHDIDIVHSRNTESYQTAAPADVSFSMHDIRTPMCPAATVGTSAQTTTASDTGPHTTQDPFSPSMFDPSALEGIESFFDDPHSADWVGALLQVKSIPNGSDLLTSTRKSGRRSLGTRVPALICSSLERVGIDERLRYEQIFLRIPMSSVKSGSSVYV